MPGDFCFLMNKLSAIKSFHNSSKLALQSFWNTWIKYYWNKIKPNDAMDSELLEML